MSSRRVGLVLGAIAVLAGLLVGLLDVAGRGWLGEPVQAGMPMGDARSFEMTRDRTATDRAAAASLGVVDGSQILFGDLHVHSTFSLDAFCSLDCRWPRRGYGPFTVADACDFARHCAGLDFWSDQRPRPQPDAASLARDHRLGARVQRSAKRSRRVAGPR